MIKCLNCPCETRTKFCSSDCRKKYNDNKYKTEMREELKAATKRKRASQPLKKRHSYPGDWLEAICHL